jgi:hypothetical protein
MQSNPPPRFDSVQLELMGGVLEATTGQTADLMVWQVTAYDRFVECC